MPGLGLRTLALRVGNPTYPTHPTPCHKSWLVSSLKKMVEQVYGGVGRREGARPVTAYRLRAGSSDLLMRGSVGPATARPAHLTDRRRQTPPPCGQGSAQDRQGIHAEKPRTMCDEKMARTRRQRS